MHPSQQSASTATQASECVQKSSWQVEDRVYQLVTVAAILMVLGSLWLF
jgi:hypothetical protein